MMLINPIDNLAARMMNFYKINFGKEIDLKTNHELEILEEIFEKIVLETKIGKTDLE
jgi:methionyl-tRNA synthetase